MLENPTAAQLEEIRQTGKTGSYVAQWGYHATEDGQIFYLEKGEALPQGWHASPGAAFDAAASDPADDKPAAKPTLTLPRKS